MEEVAAAAAAAAACASCSDLRISTVVPAPTLAAAAAVAVVAVVAVVAAAGGEEGALGGWSLSSLKSSMELRCVAMVASSSVFSDEREEVGDSSKVFFWDEVGERGGGDRGERNGERICFLAAFFPLLFGERGGDGVNCEVGVGVGVFSSDFVVVLLLVLFALLCFVSLFSSDFVTFVMGS